MVEEDLRVRVGALVWRRLARLLMALKVRSIHDAVYCVRLYLYICIVK